MELFLHNKISEEQTLWWNLYSVTTEQHERNELSFLYVFIGGAIVEWRKQLYDLRLY